MYRLQAWQYRRFHPSYLVAWLSVGVLAGLVAAKVWHLSVDELGLIYALVILLGAFHSRRWWTIIIVIISGIFIGSFRGAHFVHEINKYQKYVGAQVLIRGTINDDPEYGKRGDQRFKISQVSINGKAMTGEVYVGTFSILDVKRGDIVTLRGKLRDGFGSYQASLSYATLENATKAHDAVREFRDTFAAGTRNVMPEPAASLGLGFVVGQRSALPADLDDQLRIVGLTHIVVASGYNLTILVRFMRRLLARHSKYLAFASSTGLMVGFVAVSGLSPSMTRAAAVTGLSLLAWYYGRRFHPFMLILYVAAVTSWWYPVYIWSDIGWYLSFLAFAGVLIVAPLLTRVMYRERDASTVMQLIIETIAAQIMTLPLILCIFGQLPVLSLLSNLLVAPMIPLAMLLTAVAGAAGMIAPGVLGIFGVIAGWVVGYALGVVKVLSSASWAQLQVTISAFTMGLLYAAVACAALAVWVKTRYNFRTTSVID